jgi:hypothetical protein
MLNAFCRVAPSVLFNFLAIFAAAVFFFASDFNSRTSTAVQARRFFDFLAINPPFQERQTGFPLTGRNKTNHWVEIMKIVAVPAHTAGPVNKQYCQIVLSNLSGYRQIQLSHGAHHSLLVSIGRFLVLGEHLTRRVLRAPSTGISSASDMVGTNRFGCVWSSPDGCRLRRRQSAESGSDYAAGNGALRLRGDLPNFRTR